MTEWPNSHNLKIQDGGCRHLEFRKNVNNSGLNNDICVKFYGKMHRGHAEMTSQSVSGVDVVTMHTRGLRSWLETTT